MALRAGRKDPVLQTWSEQELLDASGGQRNLARPEWTCRSGFRPLPCALNSQLRTGADKGNPTV
jgi:hypothetical protein